MGKGGEGTGGGVTGFWGGKKRKKGWKKEVVVFSLTKEKEREGPLPCTAEYIPHAVGVKARSRIAAESSQD